MNSVEYLLSPGSAWVLNAYRAQYAIDLMLSEEHRELGEVQAATFERTRDVGPVGENFARHVVAGEPFAQEQLFFPHQAVHLRIDLIVTDSLFSPHFFCETPCTTPLLKAGVPSESRVEGRHGIETDSPAGDCFL
jgi:hypothetical protein